MEQVLHGSAATTHAIRAAIQRSKASLQALSDRYGINPKTVAKWRKRTSLEDRPMGRKAPRSTVLSADQETLMIEFRRRSLLPLDDCLYALQATIPPDTFLAASAASTLWDQSSLDDPSRSAAPDIQSLPGGLRPQDFAEVWTEEGKLYLLVAVDRISRFAFAELHDRATRRVAADFLRRLLEHVPYRIHTVLTVSAFGRTHLTTRAPSTGSTIASRNSIILGPTGKSNG